MQILGAQPVSLSSTLTRPNNTTAYAQNDLIADNVTAGSVIVPSFTLPVTDARVLEITRGRLITNLTTGFTTFSGHIELFSAAPTFTNGDNGAFAIATGAASWVGHMTTDIVGAYHQYGDGATVAVLNGAAAADDYSRDPILIPLSPGGAIYWAMRETDATGFTPIANQTFTLKLDGFLY